jgi:hypothetical protein
LWRFAAERQRIFRARLLLASAPLTSDRILQVYKFTNAYRASDRTSQYLIRHVIYDKAWSWRDTLLRILLFKLFNRIETWELISGALGEVSTQTFDVEHIGSILDEALQRGDAIYSAAYIMPSANIYGFRRKHRNHLHLLEQMLAEHLDERLAQAGSMGQAFELLVSYPSIGPFLGFQLITDLNYAPDMSFSEDEFVVPGPGAVDGVAKCFYNRGDLTVADIIRWTMDTQQEQFTERGIVFADLWDRPLQLIDCQNLYCEIGKYSRAAHPEFVGRSRRTRIKQRFKPRVEPITAWYPPKWGINQRVEEWRLSETGAGNLRK